MNPDPIVKEVREAGAKLAAEAGYDVHRFFENLRKAEKEYRKRLIREPVTKPSWKRPRRRLKAKGAGLSSAVIKERRRKGTS